MNAQDRLRAAIDAEETRLRRSVPPDLPTALRTLTQAIDQRATDDPASNRDILTGHPVRNLAGNRALALCYAGENESGTISGDPNQRPESSWAQIFLDEVEHLVRAELIVAHCETGFMRVTERDEHDLDAWIATKRIPTSWHERTDFASWKSLLETQRGPSSELHEIRDQGPIGPHEAKTAADVLLAAMSYQLGYPTDGFIGTTPIRTYLRVLHTLIVQMMRSPLEYAEDELVHLVARETSLDAFIARDVISAFTVSRENAAYHATVPGIASAPMVLVPPDRLILSSFGLSSEPLLFLTRELRRRDSQAYHNSAHLREQVFRSDLYRLFADKRFVTSTNRIELRRNVGDLRTDIDATLFDRKTGTLGVFELKSQDPFARSTAELHRQRDNVLYANRQVSGILDWIKREGGDEILRRIDPKLAKTFRVQKVFPFVLGRYLVHFNDGPQPDPRAAWATWPELLRLVAARPTLASESNPIASIFANLTKHPPEIDIPTRSAPLTITLGPVRLRVYPSRSAYEADT